MLINMKLLIAAFFLMNVVDYAAAAKKPDDRRQSCSQDEKWTLAAEVKLPDEKELKKRIRAFDFQHFDEITKFSSKNANKQVKIIFIASAVVFAYVEYFKNIEEGMPEGAFEAVKNGMYEQQENFLTEVLLKDFPQAKPVITNFFKQIRGS